MLTLNSLWASVTRCVVVIGAVWIAATQVAAAAEPALLLDAAERGDRAAAMQLLSKGANPNTPGPDGTTALMWAASNDDLELVRALIKAGANVSLKNQFGTSALTEAAIIGSAPVIEALLKAGADPNTKNPEGETPLMAVARAGKVDAVFAYHPPDGVKNKQGSCSLMVCRKTAELGGGRSPCGG